MTETTSPFSGFEVGGQPLASPGALEYVRFSDQLTQSLESITQMINQHKAMIDAIQEIGIQLTASFGSLHRVTVRYARIVNAALDLLLPWFKKVPLVPPRLLELATTVERITQNIIDSGDQTAKTIRDVNAGLRAGDVNQLRGRSADLQRVTQLLSSIVPDDGGR